MSGDGGQSKGAEPELTSTSSTTEQPKSRDNSPPRPSRSLSAIPQLSRSRKNSQEFSPTRNTALSGTLSTIPSAAAVQRALSAQRPPLQPNGVDGNSDSVRSRQSGTTISSWPTSPRIKSPPPSSTNRQPLIKRVENENIPSNTSMKRLSSTPNADNGASTRSPENGWDSAGPSTAPRPTGRGASAASALEPVAEGSVPTTPAIDPMVKSFSDSKIDETALTRVESASDASTVKNGDNGNSKSTASKAEGESRSRALSTPRAGSNLAKRSLTSLTGAKPKPPDQPRTMTIETEPVTTTPQLLGPDRLIARDGGSVRTKPSNETIRPKKEKKKTTRKAPSLHSGTVTSKADIFEAKVASAVDEADTSDSDETFVYESNPPDSRSHRHHSRTPSATSLASTDHHGRNRHGLRSGSHAVGAKKSMKFSNSGYNNGLDQGDDGRGSIRNSSSHRPHHIGRHGKAAHSSILDANSPFNQSSKNGSPRTSTTNLGRLSRPNSPRLLNGRASSSPKKGDAFDVYDNPADDERTPLMGGSVRVTRNRHARRSGLRNAEYFDEADRSVCRRMTGCFALGFVVLIVCAGIITFVVGLSQPLIDVKIRHLQNILASEQELMLDLHVEAVNTNIFAISVTELDVNIFAESSYVGSSHDHEDVKRMRWGDRYSKGDLGGLSFGWPFPSDGIDEGTDPIEDEPGTQKMLLGTALEFDAPLLFEPFPIKRRRSSSVGEIRLAKPGNKTEVGGSERWERVLQHDFNLIVRGVIKYQLPLSSRARSVKVAGKAKVQHDADGGGGDGDGDGEPPKSSS